MHKHQMVRARHSDLAAMRRDGIGWDHDAKTACMMIDIPKRPHRLLAKLRGIS